MLSCEKKPEVLRFAGGTDADLRLEWQQFLIRMIANAFDLPAMMLGLESDVNRSTAGEMADEAFQSAVKFRWRSCSLNTSRATCLAKLPGLARVRISASMRSGYAANEQEEVAIQVQLLNAGDAL